MDIEKFKERLDEWINSPEGDAYFEKKAKLDEIKLGRYRKFEEKLESMDFDNFMYRLILQHDGEWREKCWQEGHEVYPNNVLGFIFDYVTHNHQPIRVPQIESEHFPSETYFFKGFYFQILYGQGSIMNIYNGKDKKLLLSV